MRILLCNIHDTPEFRKRPGGFARHAPLGLGYVAGALVQAGHEVRIVDDYVLTPQEIFDLLAEFQPRIVAFGVFTAHFIACCAWAGQIKKIYPNTTIVFGGHHPTMLQDVTRSEPSVDIIIRGEGELAMCRIAEAISRGENPAGIPGVLYRNPDGQMTDNGPPEQIEDLDALPFPAYDLLNLDAYVSSASQRVTRMPFTTTTTQRGCHHQCQFCGKLYGRRVRYRSPENVIEEIMMLQRDFGVGEILYVDDDFTSDKDRALEICELIRRHDLKFVYHINCRVDSVSREVLEALAETGCRSVFFGVEHGSQKMLDAMGKHTTVEQAETAVRDAKETIGWVSCGFVFGLPGETRETIEESIRFAIHIDPMIANFHFAIPMPGSPLFLEGMADGRISRETLNWEDFDMTPKGHRVPVASFSELDEAELLSLVKKAHRAFYFRPRYILRLLRRLGSPWGLRYVWLGVKELMAQQLANRRWRPSAQGHAMTCPARGQN